MFSGRRRPSALVLCTPCVCAWQALGDPLYRIAFPTLISTAFPGPIAYLYQLNSSPRLRSANVIPKS